MHGVRMHTNRSGDTGWILNSGHESRKFSLDPKNYRPVPLELLIESDRTLSPMSDWPVGTEVTRLHVTEPWRFIVGGKVVDDEGKVLGGVRDAT
jgi:hypothetical protein